MMMDKLFNSTFENSLRILLLMDEFGKKQNLDMLYVSYISVKLKYFTIFFNQKIILMGDLLCKFGLPDKL